MAISEIKGHSLPSKGRTATLNSDRIFVQQPPKYGKRSTGSSKLLCYRLQQGETAITPQDKTKSNTTKPGTCILKYKIHITQNQHTKKPKARCSRLIQHPAWKRSGTILVKWEGMEKQ